MATFCFALRTALFSGDAHPHLRYVAEGPSVKSSNDDADDLLLQQEQTNSDSHKPLLVVMAIMKKEKRNKVKLKKWGFGR